MTTDPQPNPMVLYLTSLRTQEADANPSYVYENRAAFLEQLRQKWPWFPSEDELHVTTQLDELVDLLRTLEAWPKIVVLTGDAGDGKTAFCARLARALGHEGELEPVTTLGRWVVVKDASEIPQDELVARILATEANPESRVIMAINEGRLRRLARGPLADRDTLRREVIEPSLETWLDEAQAERLDAAMQEQRWLVLNFRHRFHVRRAAPALLEAWTKPALWEGGPSCGGCPARDRCSVLANVKDLREPLVRRCVCDALASVHFSGQRLPLRRLQAVLALACTGGLRCEHVQTGPLAEPDTELEALRYRFYDVLFARDSVRTPVRVEPEQLCRALAPFDPGRDAERSVDEQIALRVVEGGDAEPLGSLERAGVARVRAIAREADDDGNSLSPRLAELIRHLRRYRAMTTPAETFLPTWRRALLLLEEFAATGEESALQQALLRGLNGLHRRPEKADALVTRQLDPGGFRDPARLALELELGTRFDVHLGRGPILPEKSVRPWLESCPSELYFVAHRHGHSDDSVRLHLDARLLAALLDARDGYVQLGALGSYRRDLARFFGQLLRLSATVEPGPRVILQRSDHRRELEVDRESSMLVLKVDPS